MRLNSMVALAVGFFFLIGASHAADLLFSDNLETGSRNPKWQSTCNGVNSTNPHTGTYSLSCNLAANQNGNIAWDPPYPTTKVYMSWWQFFPTGYIWGGQPQTCCGHWFRFYTPTWEYMIDQALQSADLTGGTIQTCINASGSHPTGDPKWWVIQYGSRVNFSDGKWHHAEAMVSYNTPGNADGSYTIWYDGQPVQNLQGRELLPASAKTPCLDHIQLPGNQGNAQTGAIQYFDDVEVWSNCPDSTLYSGKPSCGQALIVISPDVLPTPRLGVSYSATVSAAGGKGPYTWTKASGNLPSGFTFNNGVIAGTTFCGGKSNFTVQAVDANGVTKTKDYSLVISGTPCASAIHSNGEREAVNSQQFTVKSRNGRVQFNLPGAGSYSLSVYDLSGRPVWRQKTSIHTQEIEWQHGADVKGIYVVLINGSQGAYSRKFCVLR